MSKINVDHSQFSKAASEIEGHVSDVKKYIASTVINVDTLASSWEGSDYAAFRNKFDEMLSKDSTYDKYLKALEGYAKFLKFAGERYKKAQIDAYNKAKSLPKW